MNEKKGKTGVKRTNYTKKMKGKRKERKIRETESWGKEENGKVKDVKRKEG